MSTRAMGPGHGWSWLARAINLGRHNPRAVFGGAALVALVALVPGVVQLLVQHGLKLQPEQMLPLVALTTLASLLLLPPVIGGLLQVIDASERGRETRASEVFAPFRAGGGGLRLIGYGLVMTAIYLAVFLGILGAYGDGLPEWYQTFSQQVIQAEAQGRTLQPGDLPDAPAGLRMVMALGLLAGLFLGGAYAIGFGQVALGRRSVFAAVGDSFAGALKNLLPIVVLAILAVAGFFALLLVLMVVGGLLMVVGGLIHPLVAALLVAPVYFGMILVMYAVMFGVMYHMWRDICGEPAAPPPLPDDTLEV